MLVTLKFSVTYLVQYFDAIDLITMICLSFSFYGARNFVGETKYNTHVAVIFVGVFHVQEYISERLLVNIV
jgi:hypothetical protein